jgi:cytochrome c oxidase subunit 2
MQTGINRFILFLSTICSSAAALATPGINMPYGVTPISQDIYSLHMACFWVCCGIGAVVFSVLIFSLFKYRKSKGAKAALFHEHVGVEIAWTIIPTIILIALAIPATMVLQRIHNTDESKLTIKVTGYQWKWKYEYLDQGISFLSNLSTPQNQIDNVRPKGKWFLLEVDHPLVIPVNTKVKLLVTADDVIHDWWVPELGVKQDAIPGFINENWFYAKETGTFRGQCGELCGVNHAFMPIVVEVVSQHDFDLWVKAHQSTTRAPAAVAGQASSNQPLLSVPAASGTPSTPMAADQLVATGQVQYEKNCAMCHQNTGLGLPPTFPPLKGDKVAVGDPNKMISVLLNGIKGTAMQPFANQLDDVQLAAVITYVRHSWGNDELNKTNNYAVTVQPQDIAKAR